MTSCRFESCESVMHGQSGGFRCCGENLDQINRAFDAANCPLCLLEGLVAIPDGGDFKAHHAGAVPVAIEVNLGVGGVFVIAGDMDAQVDVLSIGADLALNLIACVVAVLVEELHSENHVVQSLQSFDAFVRVMELVIEDKDRILEDCQEIIESIMTTDDLDKRINAMQEQALGMAQRIRELVSENARVSRDQRDFQSEYEPLTRRYEEMTKRIGAAQKDKADKEMRAKRISLYMRLLKEQEECLEFDPVLFTAFVEKVIVSGEKKQVTLTFVMRDGSEHQVHC